jgi:hypothetical protein
MDRLRSLDGRPRTARELAYMVGRGVREVERALSHLHEAGLAHQEPGAWVAAGSQDNVLTIKTSSVRGHGRTAQLVERRRPDGSWCWTDENGEEWPRPFQKQLMMSVVGNLQERGQT